MRMGALLASGIEYDHCRPDHGRPKPKRKEHYPEQKPQSVQPQRKAGLPEGSLPRQFVIAFQRNAAPHGLLPAGLLNFERDPEIVNVAASKKRPWLALACRMRPRPRLLTRAYRDTGQTRSTATISISRIERAAPRMDREIGGALHTGAGQQAEHRTKCNPTRRR